MSSLASTPDVLLLYDQHRNYTAELGRTHQVLSKLYKKIAKVEKALAERERKERHLTRKERKKLQWTRVHTKQTIKNVEVQQMNLHDALRQSNNLIASSEYVAYRSPIMTPWFGHCDPPSPYLFSPLSPAFTPYTPVVQHGPSAQSQTQYWDLSSLPERQASLSPYGSRSADSGFHEPQVPGLNTITEGERLINAQHVYAREMMSRFNFDANNLLATAANDDGQTHSPERDVVPDLGGLVSPTTCVGASDTSTARSHKRCVSANAVQLNTDRLAPPSTKRGTSVGPVPDKREKIPASGLDGDQK
ncbi:hypothetical protein Slin14017_G065020 [Septoria linicola]|nr:hypothetical protein Slin14017_G065020 [Septoria linicola]